MLNIISQTIVKIKINITCFKTCSFLNCFNQAGPTDCVIAVVVLDVVTVDFRSPIIPDLDLYLENSTVVMG